MAKKISTFSMTHLLVPTHYEFHASVVNLIRDATAEALLIEDLAVLYTEAVTTLFDAINRQRGSELTTQIADLDKQRDAYLSELFHNIDAARRSPIAARAQAGNALTRLVSPYRGIAANEYNKETAQIRGLQRDLGTDEAAVHINALTLGPIVSGLRQTNNQFAALMDQRNVQAGTRAAAIDVNTDRQQRVVNQLYKDITEKVNAVALLQPTEAVNTFIDKLNGYIIEYKRVSDNMRPGGTGSEKGTTPKTTKPDPDEQPDAPATDEPKTDDKTNTDDKNKNKDENENK